VVPVVVVVIVVVVVGVVVCVGGGVVFVVVTVVVGVELVVGVVCGRVLARWHCWGVSWLIVVAPRSRSWRNLLSTVLGRLATS